MADIIYVCRWLDRKGNIKSRDFQTMDAGLKFCAKLDRRIKRNAVRGYTFSYERPKVET